VALPILRVSKQAANALLRLPKTTIAFAPFPLSDVRDERAEPLPMG
jgi:hypothetical protein